MARSACPQFQLDPRLRLAPRVFACHASTKIEQGVDHLRDPLVCVSSSYVNRTASPAQSFAWAALTISSDVMLLASFVASVSTIQSSSNGSYFPCRGRDAEAGARPGGHPSRGPCHGHPLPLIAALRAMLDLVVGAGLGGHPTPDLGVPASMEPSPEPPGRPRVRFCLFINPAFCWVSRAKQRPDPQIAQ